MLGCGKFLSVGGEFVVQQVVELLRARPLVVLYNMSVAGVRVMEFGTKPALLKKNERYYWTRKAPSSLLTVLLHYGKPRLCINIHHYTPPTGYSVTYQSATSLAAPRC